MALACSLLPACSGALELRGLCVTDGVAQLSFSDSDTRASYGWQRVGEAVKGYRIVAYDQKTETATLTKGAETLKLPLLAGVLLKSRPADPNRVSGTVTIKGKDGQITTGSLDLPFGEERAFALASGRVLKIGLSKMPDGNFLYLVTIYDHSGGGPGRVLSAPSVVTEPYGEFGLGVDEDEIAFAPVKR